MTKQLVLASASPRRKELLDQIGVSYTVYPVDIDETPKQSEIPQDYVFRVAAEKAAVCMLTLNSPLPVLAADTSVVIDGCILGKPENKEHAHAMLNKLSGNWHSVYSAVSLRCCAINEEIKHFQALSITEVKFRTIQPHEIQAYWETGEPLGKAGAYAIQGLASVFVESINGSFSGVVGLPLFETAELLSKQGIKVIT
ncbi:MAG: Maf family nucleotide pyrophosphatase [Methylococcaceae bacterium]|nr:Maf family nucleotide pyrophosphatase [Methylococcaceae bacterium]